MTDSIKKVDAVLHATTVPNVHVNAPICSAMKQNKMKCERLAQMKIVNDVGAIASMDDVNLAGGVYFCAEHFSLLILKGKNEGFRVEKI